MKRALTALPVLCLFAARTAFADPPPLPQQVLSDPLQAPDGVGTDPAQAKQPEGPVVYVTGDKADSLQKTPGSSFLLSNKDLQRAAPVDLAEMLRRVPGVTSARQEYGGGTRLDIAIRGLDPGRSRRILLLEDGIPLSLNPYSEADMYFAPAVERYRGIEVVKGSGNILFGPQTLAGTINFLTIAPPDRPTLTLDADGGTYGYAKGLARWGDTIGDTRYVVQVATRRGDGFHDNPWESQDALGKVILPTGRDGELMVRLGFHRDEATSEDVGFTSAMYKSDPRRATLDPHNHSILDRYDVALVHEQRLTSSTKLHTLLYAYETDRIWRRQGYTRSAAAGESYERILGDVNTPSGAIYFQNTNTVLDRSYQVAGFEPRFESKFDTLGVKHTLDYGGRALREAAHYDQRSGTYPDSYAGSNDFEEKHLGTAFSGYVQDRIAATDNLLLTPGIRYEHFEFTRTVLRQNTGAVVEDVFNQGSSAVNGVVPGAGVIYGTKNANVFGGIHLGFAPPRVASAISPKGVPADVHAEQSLDYELGTRFAATKWLRIEATGFLSSFTNQVVVNNAASSGSDTSLADAGATLVRGAEFALVTNVGKALKLPLVVDVGARYTFSRATFRYGDNAGNLLPYAPEHTASANLDIEHEVGLGGEIAWTYNGKQFTDAQNTRAEDVTGRIGAIDPWTVFDATVHYHHKPSNITLRLTAKNLFDTVYVQARRPEGIFTGGFRQLLLGVKWEWEGKPRDAAPAQ